MLINGATLIAKGTLTDKAFESLKNYAESIDLSSVTIEYKEHLYNGEKINIYAINNKLYMITDNRDKENKIIDTRSTKNAALAFISKDTFTYTY
jgi:hypothetical protein